jgi:hypothetical protein
MQNPRSHAAPIHDGYNTIGATVVMPGDRRIGRRLCWRRARLAGRPAAFDGWSADGWHTGASQRKVCQVLWHSTAQHVLASAVGDHTVKLWDLGAPKALRAVLAGPAGTIQSLGFNPTGQRPRPAIANCASSIPAQAATPSVLARATGASRARVWSGWATVIASRRRALAG